MIIYFYEFEQNVLKSSEPFLAQAVFVPIFQRAPRVFHRGIRNKKVYKVKNLSYGLPQDILSKKAKSKGGRDVQHPPDPCFEGLIILIVNH